MTHFAQDRDHGHDCDRQEGDIGQRITQHLRDSVVRDAAQTGFDEHQLVEQPDHWNGQHNEENLRCADDKHVKQWAPPCRATCDADRAEDAHWLVSGPGRWSFLPELACSHLTSLTWTLHLQIMPSRTLICTPLLIRRVRRAVCILVRWCRPRVAFTRPYSSAGRASPW